MSILTLIYSLQGKLCLGFNSTIMKNLIILLLFAFVSSLTNANAQKDTIWYDANWKKTEKKSAIYYRPEVKKKGKLYHQVDYYMSGSKQMEAYSHDAEDPVYEGEVKWYFENGNTFQVVYYNNGVLNGKRQIYFENGKLKTESHYKDGKMQGSYITYFDNGNPKEKGQYDDNQKEGHWKIYYEDGKLKSEGKYVFDKKVDVWKTNYYDGTVSKESS